MGRMSDLQIDRLERREERLTLAPGQELTWNDIHKLTGGRIGTFALACPFCAPGKFSSSRFQVERPSLSYAKWHCFYCGVEGELRGAEMDPAAEEAALRAYEKRKTEEREANIAEALTIWEQGSQLANSPAHDYLRKRHIHDLPPNVDEVLRFHPRCRFGRQGLRPCMLALFRSIKGNKPVAIHRTLFFGDGTAQRMALGPIGSAAIKLWPADGVRLTIGEGIETVLSAALYMKRPDGAPLFPAWSLTVAKSVRHFPVLKGINELNLLVDNDESQVGQSAAKACGERWADAQRKVKLLYPENADFNDDLKEMKR